MGAGDGGDLAVELTDRTACGTTLGGELPADIMPPTVMHAFAVSGAKNPEPAKKLLAFLKSPEARKAIEAKGMKPPKE